MSDYLFLVKIDKDVDSFIQISHFTPNRKTTTNAVVDFKLGVYTQEKSGTTWKKLDEILFFSKQSVDVNSKNYNLELGQIAVIVPVELTTKLLDNLNTLPVPINRKGDRAPTNERARIAFSRDGCESSYQGEFPYKMSCAPKGSMVSFSPLLKAQNSKVINKIVLVNIHSASLLDKSEMHFSVANANTKQLLSSVKYTNNSAAIIELTLEGNQEYVFYSKDSLGIPIFISYEEKPDSLLSVEHTHPPAECFWGENKFLGQARLKKNWLKILP